MTDLKNQCDAKITVINPHEAKLSGRIDRLVGKDLSIEGRRLIAASGKQWRIDLTGVHHSSSVGIALLLDWLRYAKSNNIEIEFENVPEKMRQVIEFSGLTEIFNLN